MSKCDIFQKVKSGDTVAIEHFCKENGEDVNVKDDHEFTLIHWASTCGHKKVMEVLLRHGADANAKTKNKNTPAHNAAGSGCSTDVVEILIKAGADLNAKNILDESPAHKAAANGHTKILDYRILFSLARDTPV